MLETNNPVSKGPNYSRKTNPARVAVSMKLMFSTAKKVNQNMCLLSEQNLYNLCSTKILQKQIGNNALYFLGDHKHSSYFQSILFTTDYP
uniref:Uncharacterized protein n=1 Tax=Arundo donax TaxID=35708 RepID=A0A0A9CZV5_ARUDO